MCNPHTYAKCCSVLVRDWLHDDSVFNSIIRYVRGPMQALDDFMYSSMLSLDKVYVPSAASPHDSIGHTGTHSESASSQNPKHTLKKIPSYNVNRRLLSKAISYNRNTDSDDLLLQASLFPDTEGLGSGGAQE